MVKPVTGHRKYSPREKPCRLPDDKNKGIVRDGDDLQDGSLINPEPASANSAAGGKAGTDASNSSQKKYVRENTKKKGSPKRSLHVYESDEESQYSMETESLQAGDGITSASDSIPLKSKTKKGKASTRHKSKSKKQSINGSPRRPEDSDESDSERRDVPRKELSEAGGGIKNASVRFRYSKKQDPLPGQEKASISHASKLPEIYQNNPFHGFGKNKAIVSDGDDPRDGSVINPEPGSAKFKGIPKRPQREDESGKESQNFLGKELSEAGAGKTYAAALKELPCPGSAKTTILTEHQKLNPKVNDGSGNKSQNTPPKVHTLDLHGQKSDEAEHSIIDELLKYSSPDWDVTVKMIPGLGNNSVNGPVLNRLLRDLLERLELNYKLCNNGGAVDITIGKGWSGSLRSSNVQTSGQMFDFSEFTFVVKDASSSNAQVSRSAGKYMITANDIDAYVAVIEDSKHKIIDMKNDVISLPIDGNIFQQENVDIFYVFKEDLIDFCNMKTVDVTIISAAMRLFFANHKKSCKSITFLDPAFSCTNLSLGISEGLKKDKKNQLLFIPYIVQPTGHWVLMVIDCTTMTVYWVDSSHIEPHVTLGNHVKTGLNNSLITTNTVQPIWETIKAPMQPADSGQCGYLVMKFMRDLITDESSQSITMKMDKLARKETCTQEEINLVRAEFCNYIITVLEKISSAPVVPSSDN